MECYVCGDPDADSTRICSSCWPEPVADDDKEPEPQLPTMAPAPARCLGIDLSVGGSFTSRVVLEIAPDGSLRVVEVKP